MRYTLAAVLLILSSSSACASTGVLTDHVPPGATPAQVLSVVKESLQLRGWRVMKSDGSSVDAAIDQVNTSATLRIELKNNQLVYEGSAIRSNVSAPFQGMPKRPVAMPKAWIKRLSHDIRLTLSSIPNP